MIFICDCFLFVCYFNLNSSFVVFESHHSTNSCVHRQSSPLCVQSVLSDRINELSKIVNIVQQPTKSKIASIMSSKSLFMSNFKFKKNKNETVDPSTAYKTVESLNFDSLDTTLNTTLNTTINDFDLPSLDNDNLNVLSNHVLSADQIIINKEIGKGT